MHHLKPSKELTSYLDALEHPPARRRVPRGVVALAASAVIAIVLGVVSVALGQPMDAGPSLPSATASTIRTPRPTRSSWVGGCIGVGMVTCVVASLAMAARWRRPKWSLAAESRAGARPYNEDRCAAFVVGPFGVLVAADGCGGHPCGGRAATIAVRVTTDYLKRTLPLARGRHRELAADFVRAAYARAETALAEEDTELGLGAAGHDALRTTLIVLVASETEYRCAWQGDGGAWVIRADGSRTVLLEPAKGEAKHLLTASLGPKADGRVELRTAPMLDGDVIVVTTDGVADKVDQTWDAEVREAVNAHGSAKDAVAALVDAFEKRADLDDNISIGLVVPGA